MRWAPARHALIWPDKASTNWLELF